VNARPSLILHEEAWPSRADFAYLTDEQILRRIAAEETAQECADGDHDWQRACHALMELRAVLTDRGVLPLYAVGR
jgi:hypothetical protein